MKIISDPTKHVRIMTRVLVLVSFKRRNHFLGLMMSHMSVQDSDSSRNLFQPFDHFVPLHSSWYFLVHFTFMDPMIKYQNDDVEHPEAPQNG